ncbi:MAG: HPr family phosphocarrier protein [Planctomycetota bacterium]
MQSTVRATLRVVNPAGLHARPCHAVVTLALRHRAELAIEYGGRRVNGKSILELMTLSAAHGAELEVEANGDDAEPLVAELSQLFGSGFGELDRD